MLKESSKFLNTRSHDNCNHMTALKLHRYGEDRLSSVPLRQKWTIFKVIFQHLVSYLCVMKEVKMKFKTFWSYFLKIRVEIDFDPAWNFKRDIYSVC